MVSQPPGISTLITGRAITQCPAGECSHSLQSALNNSKYFRSGVALHAKVTVVIHLVGPDFAKVAYDE